MHTPINTHTKHTLHRYTYIHLGETAGKSQVISLTPPRWDTIPAPCAALLQRVSQRRLSTRRLTHLAADQHLTLLECQLSLQSKSGESICCSFPSSHIIWRDKTSWRSHGPAGKRPSLPDEMPTCGLLQHRGPHRIQTASKTKLSTEMSYGSNKFSRLVHVWSILVQMW